MKRDLKKLTTEPFFDILPNHLKRIRGMDLRLRRDVAAGEGDSNDLLLGSKR
jgi:hypothetical protein